MDKKPLKLAVIGHSAALIGTALHQAIEQVEKQKEIKIELIDKCYEADVVLDLQQEEPLQVQQDIYQETLREYCNKTLKPIPIPKDISEWIGKYDGPKIRGKHKGRTKGAFGGKKKA